MVINHPATTITPGGAQKKSKNPRSFSKFIPQQTSLLLNNRRLPNHSASVRQISHGALSCHLGRDRFSTFAAPKGKLRGRDRIRYTALSLENTVIYSNDGETFKNNASKFVNKPCLIPWLTKWNNLAQLNSYAQTGKENVFI
ncbi:hypothetical protein NPIL_396841 [Nephila pilipes]|uniref:Uncharacterized protein n=1 Tax=Nephila pilipes TaxID=299642 RepID=A0A8X6Q4Q6_NEPPI|nr:hypothetical protein NPIL_396841 [Nephila pilipes]